MPTSVRLDAETEGLVNRLARRTGRTKSEVIRDAIRRLAEVESNPSRPRTVYDAIAHVIGCADSGGAKLSERTGEKFYRLLVEQTRAWRSR